MRTAVVLALVTAGCVSKPPEPVGGEYTGESPNAHFHLKSLALSDGAEVPKENACEDLQHLGRSPDLRWTEPPPGTTALAVSVVDTSAEGFVHWMVLNLDPSLSGLDAGASHTGALGGAVELDNHFDRPGYGGPCPPAGAPHVYVFSVYALPKPILGYAAGQKAPADLDEHLRSMAIGTARLAGTFSR